MVAVAPGRSDACAAAGSVDLASDTVGAAALLDPLQPLADQIAWTERRAIAAAMKRSAGNRVAAARLLGMPRSVLYDRLARYPELASESGGR